MFQSFEIGLSLWVPEKRLFGGGESGEVRGADTWLYFHMKR